MSNIVERLRALADLFEAGHAPRHVVLHMRAGADEIESLRQKTQYWPDNAERDAVIRHQKAEIERLRAGGCARDQGTTQYCAEAAILAAKVGKLEAECFSLAAWQCKFLDGKTGLVAAEGGDTYCAMAKEMERLRVENIQMRFALGYPMPADLEHHILPANPFKCGTCDARAALAAQQETGHE